MGLKCVAIYRDGSKRSQPLNTKKTNEGGDKEKAPETAAVTALNARLLELETEVARLRSESGKPLRRRLSDTRSAVTHKFDIAGHEGYLTIGLFDDGHPGEMFITMAKEGSTIGGLMDSIGTLTSLALQYGVPLEALVRKFAHQRFEPSGFTKNPDIRNASSITDYVFRWMAFQFIPGYRESVTVARTQPELAMPPRSHQDPRRRRPQPGRPARPLQIRPHQFLPEPRRRPHLPHLRPRRRPQRRLLQMPQLRRKPRLLVTPQQFNCPAGERKFSGFFRALAPISAFSLSRLPLLLPASPILKSQMPAAHLPLYCQFSLCNLFISPISAKIFPILFPHLRSSAFICGLYSPPLFANSAFAVKSPRFPLDKLRRSILL
jgi:hypothetical protein